MQQAEKLATVQEKYAALEAQYQALAAVVTVSEGTEAIAKVLTCPYMQLSYMELFSWYLKAISIWFNTVVFKTAHVFTFLLSLCKRHSI